MRRLVFPLAIVFLLAPLLAAANGIPTVNLPLHPSSVRPGRAGFTLHVTGTDFVPGALVNWNGVPLATSFLSQGRLAATVPAAYVASPATVNVTVTNPAPGGGRSGPVFFTVTTPSHSLTFSQSVLTVGLTPGAIVAGDFNNDGKTDLAVLNMNQPDSCYNSGYDSVGTIQILAGNGAAAFSTASTTCFPDFLGVVGLPGLFAEDFEGNGTLGVAADWYSRGSGAMTISIYTGDGHGNLNYKSDAGGTDTSQAIIPAFADFDRAGSLGCFFVQGDGDFPGLYNCLLGSLVSGGGDYVGFAAFAGDFNGDGIMDLALLGYDEGTPYIPGPLIIAMGTAQATFVDNSATQPVTTLISPVTAVLGDFNGDGILDLALADSGSAALTVLLGNGDGTFTQKMGQPDAGLTTQFIATADLNGDGKLDLILVDSANSVLIFLGNGDGTFQTPLVVAAGNGASQVAVGDFNGDGRLDLAVVNTTDNTVSLLIQSPEATILPSSLKFGKKAVGTASNPRPVYIKNTGSAALQIASIIPSGDFTETKTCSSTLAIGQSCHLEVVFNPTAIGPRTGNITITDNAADSPQVIRLSGTGD